MDSGAAPTFEFIPRRECSTSSTCRNNLGRTAETEVSFWCRRTTDEESPWPSHSVRDTPRYPRDSTPRIDSFVSFDYCRTVIITSVTPHSFGDTPRIPSRSDRSRTRCTHANDPPDDRSYRIGANAPNGSTTSTGRSESADLSATHHRHHRDQLSSCAPPHHLHQRPSEPSSRTAGSRDGGSDGDRYPASTFLFSLSSVVRSRERRKVFVPNVNCMLRFSFTENRFVGFA